jgi:hypothetical protein
MLELQGLKLASEFLKNYLDQNFKGSLEDNEARLLD